jgi:PRTRC genetic system protein E
MFKELAPLLQQRSVVIMVNPLEGETLRVIVMPKRLNESENAALSTPVSVSGTPQELDEQLPSTLTQFVGAHLDLKNTLEIAKEEMAQAAKSARQSTKAKTAPKTDSTEASGTKTGEPKTTKTNAKPAEPKKAPPATTANLFDFGAAPAPALAPASAPVAVPTPAAAPQEVSNEDTNDEEEIVEEIVEDEQTDEELDPAA